MSLRSKLKCLLERNPLFRARLGYSIVWPMSSLAQEYIEHRITPLNADWERATRFGIFGSQFIAPVLYSWLKLTDPFFKQKTLKTAMTRAAIEQVSYGPFALACFLFGMSFLEGKSFRACANEVKQKFWPAYKTGMFYWPTVQTINFLFVPNKNRVFFVNAASFVWTTYLAHIKATKKSGAKELAFREKNTKVMDLVMDY